MLAVGTAVINLTPTPLKVWAVRELGTKDKPVLIGSVLLGTLLLAGVAGLLARRRFALGAVLLVALVAAAGAAALIQPAAGPLDALPALVTAVVGLAVLAWLLRVPRSGSRRVGRAVPSRRGFLVGAGVVAVASVVGGRRRPVRSSGRATRSPTSCCHGPDGRCPPCLPVWRRSTTGSAPFVTAEFGLLPGRHQPHRPRGRRRLLDAHHRR